MKKLTLIGILSVLGIVLSACSLPFFEEGLPFKERYVNIHKIAELSDYKNIGKIVSEKYDTGDGIIQDSWLQIQMEGLEPFQEIRKKPRQYFRNDLSSQFGIETS